MKILLDTLGGDYAPEEAIAGASLALKQEKELEICLVGPKQTIEPLCQKYGIDLSKIEMLEAKEAVLNTDHPSLFIKQKPESTLAVAFEALRKRDDLGGIVSAGPTGALLTGGVLRLGRIPGIDRPALMAALPTRKGGVVYLTDCGANMDCKSEYLLQFAIMADAYLKMLGNPSPKIALLSVGQEEGKGNELTKEAFALLKQSGLNFIGNIEGDHILKGKADIVICDGFSGNVFLKGTEEACYFVSDLFKKAVAGNLIRKIGALFQLKGLKEVKKPFDYAKKGCSPLFGLRKLVVKVHGKSKRETIANGLLTTNKLLKESFTKKIEEALIK